MKFKNLDKELAARQLTYKELATAANVSQKTLCGARRGKQVNTSTAGKVASALNVPVEEIAY